MRRAFLSFMLAIAPTVAIAEPVVPSIAILAAHADRRFPQPVQAGSLLGRDMLEPAEKQPVLGRVVAVARRDDGGTSLVVDVGGLLGFGSRPVTVPIEAIGLLGEHVALVGITSGQLQQLPTTLRNAASDVPPTEELRIGLVKPFH